MHSLLIVLVAAAGCAVEETDARLGDLPTVEAYASVHQWTDDVQIPNQTSPYQVALAARDNRLHMLKTGNDGRLRWSRFDGVGWSGASDLGHQAEYGPAMTTVDGNLVAIYHKRNENRLMMMTYNGSSWSTPVTAGASLGQDQIRYAPAVVHHGGALYTAYCRRPPGNSIDVVQVDRHDGGPNWTRVASFVAEIGLSSACKHVAMTSLPDGRLDIMWTFEMKDYVWRMREATSTDLQSWSTRDLTMVSKKPPSFVTCDGLTHLVHGGNSDPEQIWWSVRENGDWLPDTRVPSQSSAGGAALGCFGGDRTIMVHNGGTSQLWWSEFGN